MIDWLLKPKASTYQGGISPSEDGVLYRLFGKKTKSGAAIDENNVSQISAFYCGVTKISDSLKLMPCELKQKLDIGGSTSSALPQGNLLKRKPNDQISPSRFKWLIGAWTLTWGNFYAEIERNGFGVPVALWPIHPSRVNNLRGPGDVITHRVLTKSGTWVEIRSTNMIHVFRRSPNGLDGTGAVNELRETFGTALAADQYAAKFFGNNAMPAHLVVRSEDLDPEHLKNFREGWYEQNSGDKSGGIHFLGGGDESTKIHTLSINNTDSQLLETRQFNIQEIARAIPISPMMLYEYGRATWGNFSEVRAMYLGESVMPIGQDFEEECDRKLLTEAERDAGHYFKFNTRGVLRVEGKEQYESFTQALNNGFMCVDEVRELLDLNPLPDGEGQVFMRPANMTPTAELAAKISRIKTGTASAADVDFLREVVKSFLGDKTTNDVIYNLTGVSELMRLVGIPMEPGAVAPWLPVVADSGPLVSGGTVTDDEGDVVGGDVLPAKQGPTDTPPNPDAPPPTDGSKDGQADPGPSGDSGSDASGNDSTAQSRAGVIALSPVLAGAIERMGRVESNAEKRIAKAKDSEATANAFWSDHELTVNGEFGKVFDSAAGTTAAILDKTIDPEQVRAFTAQQARLYCEAARMGNLPTADSILTSFCQEFIR